jgi:transposase InsO family protein
METRSPFWVAPGKSRRGDPMLLRGRDPLSWKISSSDTAGQLAILEGLIFHTDRGSEFQGTRVPRV